MKSFGDWKWYAALVIFAHFTALVVWLPGPQAKSTDAIKSAAPTASPADLSPVGPGPAADERESMLQYTVQDDDTVAKIAHLFVISEEDLRRANHIPAGGEVVAGKNIRVPTQ